MNFIREGVVMTQQELETRIAELEARIRELEDVEEIQRLMATYVDYLDSLQRLDELLSLFAEDATCVVVSPGAEGAEGGLLGTYEGMDRIRELYSQVNPTTSSYEAHHVTNPNITIDGNKAKGRWYLLCPFTTLTPQGPMAMWEQGTYDNEFVKVDGKWRFSVMRFEFNFMTTHEDGWVKSRMMGM
jgi:hypothetical protein